MPHRADLEVLCDGARASCVASGNVPGDGLARVRGASGAVKSLLQLAAAAACASAGQRAVMGDGAGNSAAGPPASTQASGCPATPGDPDSGWLCLLHGTNLRVDEIRRGLASRAAVLGRGVPRGEPRTR